MRPDDTPTYRQMAQVIDCPDCLTGKVWHKTDELTKPVVLAAEPCAKHLRMLTRLGWTR